MVAHTPCPPKLQGRRPKQAGKKRALVLPPRLEVVGDFILCGHDQFQPQPLPFSLKLETGAAPIRPTAGTCYLTGPADWCAGCRNPKLTWLPPANNLLVTGRSWETSLATVSWASAASVEADTAGSKIEALEGEEWTSAFYRLPYIDHPVSGARARCN